VEQPYRMTAMEIAWGYVVGQEGAPFTSHRGSASPRQALQHVLTRSLRRPPCAVSFSGGRDSSLILAVATEVARREGLPLPIPITRVFPQVPDADEQEWQEAVVRHLRLDHWERIQLGDELDVLGPLSQDILRRYGVVWPPTAAVDVPLIVRAAGGSVVDGEGGDEVLGVEAHRVAPLTWLVRSPRPLRWRRVRRAAGSMAPAIVRAGLARRRFLDMPLSWLRPAALDPLIEALVAAERAQPLSFAASVSTMPMRRTQVLGARTRDALAHARDVAFTSPLLDHEFVHAVSRDGRFLGRGDRTTVLRFMAADLLPDSVLSRTTKATFTHAYMGAHTRAFAEQWDGAGLDPMLVDSERLRGMWLSESPAALTSALIQAAWLAHL
jgi:asparagine synthase (glutamine-hydrolysing)